MRIRVRLARVEAGEEAFQIGPAAAVVAGGTVKVVALVVGVQVGGYSR